MPLYIYIYREREREREREQEGRRTGPAWGVGTSGKREDVRRGLRE
jgi:hypothetical protein